VEKTKTAGPATGRPEHNSPKQQQQQQGQHKQQDLCIQHATPAPIRRDHCITAKHLQSLT
jgi:hypothetical protein